MGGSVRRVSGALAADSSQPSADSSLFEPDLSLHIPIRHFLNFGLFGVADMRHNASRWDVFGPSTISLVTGDDLSILADDTATGSRASLPTITQRRRIPTESAVSTSPFRGFAMHVHSVRRLVAVALAGVIAPAVAASTALAQAVSVSGTSYTQNFDAIVTGSTSSIATAAPGWQFFKTISSNTNPINITPSYAPTIAPSGTTVSSGSTYLNSTNVTQNAGTAGTGVVSNLSSAGAYLWVSGTLATGTDKSIGFLSTGSYPGTTKDVGQQLAILFGFTNSTGSTITNLDLGWNYERYRMGTRTQSWEFYTSSDGATWSANSAGNQTYSGTSISIVYNPPESTAKTVSIPSLSIASGSSYYLRWSYVTTGSWTNAQGLGIDDFTMSLTTSPDLYWAGGSWTATAPGAGGNGSWADGSGSWNAAKTANFGGTAGTIAVGTVTASNGLVFTTSGYALSGGTITLAGTSSELNTITTGTDGTVSTTISSVIAGSAGLTKAGPGTLTLSGSNTYGGTTAVDAGVLVLGASNVLSDSTAVPHRHGRQLHDDQRLARRLGQAYRRELLAGWRHRDRQPWRWHDDRDRHHHLERHGRRHLGEP
ncbi:MAG: hypothetical protein EBZ59_04385 [Planctomycetia bacterium]|nr:hypothetical protein [Planctomycetia bacterium]